MSKDENFYRIKDMGNGLWAFFGGSRIIQTGTHAEIYPFAFGYLSQELEIQRMEKTHESLSRSKRSRRAQD